MIRPTTHQDIRVVFGDPEFSATMLRAGKIIMMATVWRKADNRRFVTLTALEGARPCAIWEMRRWLAKMPKPLYTVVEHRRFPKTAIRLAAALGFQITEEKDREQFVWVITNA
jgi:hypothetical protein